MGVKFLTVEEKLQMWEKEGQEWTLVARLELEELT